MSSRDPESHPGPDRAAETLSAMRPEDVPSELVTAFKRAELMAALDENADPVRAVLARFIPAVREQVYENVWAAAQIATCASDRAFMELLARSLRGEDVSAEVAPRRIERGER